MKYYKFLITLLLLNPITIQNLQAADGDDDEWVKIDPTETTNTPPHQILSEKLRDKTYFSEKFKTHAQNPNNINLSVRFDYLTKWKSLDKSDQAELIKQWKLDNTETLNKSLKESKKQYNNELTAIRSSAENQIKEYNNDILSNNKKIKELNEQLKTGIKKKVAFFIPVTLTVEEKTEIQATIKTLTENNTNLKENITAEDEKTFEAQKDAEKRSETRNARIQKYYLEKSQDFQQGIYALNTPPTVIPWKFYLSDNHEDLSPQDQQDDRIRAKKEYLKCIDRKINIVTLDDLLKTEEQDETTTKDSAKEKEFYRNLDRSYQDSFNIESKLSEAWHKYTTQKNSEDYDLYRKARSEYINQIETTQTLISESLQNLHTKCDNLNSNHNLTLDEKNSMYNAISKQINYLDIMQKDFNAIRNSLVLFQ